MGLAPLQCGTSLGIPKHPGMYRVGRAISIPPPNEPSTINRWLSHTCGDRAASGVSSYTPVYSVANSEEKPRVESLRSVLKAIADQQSNADARQRLEMLVPKALRVEENIKTLK